MTMLARQNAHPVVYTDRMHTRPIRRAKVFKSGNSQAVRLPKDFRFDATEVEIFRRGDEVVLRAAAPDMRQAVALLQELAENIEVPEDYPPEPVPRW